VGEAGRAEAVLAEQVALAAAAEHLRLVHSKVLDDDLAVTGAAVHRVFLRAADEDGKGGPMGVGDEPLVAVDDPLLAVLVRLRLDEGRVAAGHLGLGHGEAGRRPSFAQRPEVLLLLLVGAPMLEGVHVALVGRLGVEHPRSVVALGCFGLDHRVADVAECHAAPLLGHVWHPQAFRVRLLAQRDELSDVCLAVGVLESFDLGFFGGDHLTDEGANAQTEFFDVGREGEVDGHDPDVNSSELITQVG